MRVLVPVKRVVDFAVRVRIGADKKAVDLNGVKMAVNPFCEIALEEAIRLKEKKIATEVVAVSVGPKACQDTLRTALAMGADTAIHVEADLRTDQELQPLAVAKILKKIAEDVKPDLIIAGKQAIDDDSNMTGQMLAGMLNWPQATYISKLNIDGTSVTAEREIDGGLQELKFDLPAVVTTDLRLNEARYVTLPNIMKARKKPIDSRKAADMDVDLTPRLTTLEVNDPPKREAGVKVESVDELVNKLLEKGLMG